MSFSIRPIFPSDQRTLWDMLYLSLYVPPGSAPFPRDIIKRPEIAKYVASWGRAGDLGFVAIDPDSNQAIGAAWLRLLRSEERGYGYVDDETPELAIAVLPEYRGKGIGSELISHLLSAAATVYKQVSLSVSADNPAVRLYKRLGFEEVLVDGSSVTMLKQIDKDGQAPTRHI